jgi:hypothetical protein
MVDTLVESAIEFKLRPIESQLRAIGNAFGYYAGATDNKELAHTLSYGSNMVDEILRTVWHPPKPDVVKKVKPVE